MRQEALCIFSAWLNVYNQFFYDTRCLPGVKFPKGTSDLVDVLAQNLRLSRRHRDERDSGIIASLRPTSTNLAKQASTNGFAKGLDVNIPSRYSSAKRATNPA